MSDEAESEEQEELEEEDTDDSAGFGEHSDDADNEDSDSDLDADEFVHTTRTLTSKQAFNSKYSHRGHDSPFRGISTPKTELHHESFHSPPSSRRRSRAHREREKEHNKILFPNNTPLKSPLSILRFPRSPPPLISDPPESHSFSHKQSVPYFRQVPPTLPTAYEDLIHPEKFIEVIPDMEMIIVVKKHYLYLFIYFLFFIVFDSFISHCKSYYL